MTEPTAGPPGSGRTEAHDGFLFAACFVALVATSFAFIIRVMLMSTWQVAFALSETQKGEIFGAGLWPFGLSIVLFSLIIDRVGYGRSMIFAFACHVVSAVLMISARGYWWLYLGSILNGLAAGAVEAIINPAVASMYPRSKTKMLTILHAGWPGGFVLGGIAVLILGRFGVDWHVNVGIILAPVLAYGLMLLKARFPLSERVAAGVPYKDMLREAGAVGWLIAVYLICMEINRVAGLGTLLDTRFLDLPSLPMTIIMGVLVVGYFAYTRSLGRWMYILLLLVMILLAITELGTDTWIKDLMAPAMREIGLHPGLVLVYTALIMMILRFCIAPIEKLLRPLGVLFVSSLFAAAGLYLLSDARGIWILVWATIYGTGQCFFWPVTLGLVSERFPRGGALTLNAIAGVGMLGVGIVGSQMLGFWQDTRIDRELRTQPALHAECMAPTPLESIFGKYTALNRARVSQIEDTVRLNDYQIRKIKERLAKEMGPDEGAKFLADRQKADARAERRLEEAIARIIPTEAFAAELAEDKEYRTLVRAAADHLAPGKPKHDATREEKETYKKRLDAHRRATKTHADRLAYLRANKILLDPSDAAALAAARIKKKILDKVQADAKQDAMSSVAILPLIMAGCYLGLIIYFRAKGGYKAVQLTAEGEVAGEHTPGAAEEVADAEDTPSE